MSRNPVFLKYELGKHGAAPSHRVLLVVTASGLGRRRRLGASVRPDESGKLTSGPPAPPPPSCFCLRRQEADLRLTVRLPVLAPRPSRRKGGAQESERGRGGGEGGVVLAQLREEPALPPCFHGDEPPTVFSCGTASASESSSQWRLGPSLSPLLQLRSPSFFFFLYCLRVF